MESFLLIFCLGLLIYIINVSGKMRQIEQKLLVSIADLKIRIFHLEQQLSGKAPTPAEKPAPVIQTQPIAKVETEPLTVVVQQPIPIVGVPTKKPVESFSTFIERQEEFAPERLKNPSPPAEPNLFERLFTSIKNYFLSGNTIVKVGVVLIFFGVSFLLKYAIDNEMIPIELRLAASALFAIGLVKLGWNLRAKSRDYGLILQGGGIGILILVTFVSMKYYSLVPTELGFFLLVFFTMVTAFLAVVQDSKNLAIFGLLGGFMAPILASSGQGQHVVLFSYYTILNLGILYIAWKKSWTELNLLGFIFTFVIGTFWGVLKYRTEFYSTTQPFLIIFFLIYASIPLIFARKKEPELKGYVDGTIVFGNSAISLFLQLQLVKDIEYAGAFSALALAAYYVFVSRYLIKSKNPNNTVLAEAFVSIAIVFTTIAIPLAFDGIKTSAIWAIEAAGIYWVAVRQKRKLARYFATLLIFITSISYFLGPRWSFSEYLFLNIFYYSCLFIALSSYFISYLMDKYKTEISPAEHSIAPFAFLMASFWWICGGIYEIDRFMDSWKFNDIDSILARTIRNQYGLSITLGYLAVGMVISIIVAQKINWSKLRVLSQTFVFALILFFIFSVMEYPHPFGQNGFIAWISACCIYLFVLKKNESFLEEQHFLFKVGHTGLLWVIAGLLAREMNWLGLQYVEESSAWRYAGQALGPIAIIFIVSEYKNLISWPIAKFHQIYLHWGLIPIALCSWYWLFYTNWFNNGTAAPLNYLPLFNPLEIVQLLTLTVLSIWLVKTFNQQGQQKWVGGTIGLTAFIWLNGVLCRSLHQYMKIPFDFSSLFAAVEVQVALSLFWTILGIILMTYASKKHLRWLWIVGAGLLGVVVFKMFMIDLSKTETIARVISFIGVGILFLVVGYFSPIPPKAIEAKG